MREGLEGWLQRTLIEGNLRNVSLRKRVSDEDPLSFDF